MVGKKRLARKALNLGRGMMSNAEIAVNIDDAFITKGEAIVVKSLITLPPGVCISPKHDDSPESKRRRLDAPLDDIQVKIYIRDPVTAKNREASFYWAGRGIIDAEVLGHVYHLITLFAQALPKTTLANKNKHLPASISRIQALARQHGALARRGSWNMQMSATVVRGRFPGGSSRGNARQPMVLQYKGTAPLRRV